MAYVGQFDNLVRERDRGHAVRFTRTIVVFADGLAVCPVPVGGRSALLRRSVLGWAAGPGPPARQISPEQIRDSAVAMGAGGTAGAFAAAWRGRQVFPFAVVDRIVLARPYQVSRLEIYEVAGRDGGPSQTVYLGDLPADGVRDTLGPLLGDRLQIDVGT